MGHNPFADDTSGAVNRNSLLDSDADVSHSRTQPIFHVHAFPREHYAGLRRRGGTPHRVGGTCVAGERRRPAWFAHHRSLAIGHFLRGATRKRRTLRGVPSNSILA